MVSMETIVIRLVAWVALVVLVINKRGNAVFVKRVIMGILVQTFAVITASYLDAIRQRDYALKDAHLENLDSFVIIPALPVPYAIKQLELVKAVLLENMD